MNKKLNLILEKCIAVNPEIVTCEQCVKSIGYLTFSGKWYCDTCSVHSEVRPIRLADVLLALRENENIKVSRQIDAMGKWNLRADDLEKQSEETIDFLADLLKSNYSNP